MQDAIKGRGSFTLASYIRSGHAGDRHGSADPVRKPVSFPEGEGKLKPEGIEISPDGVNMEQLVNFLYRIEYSGKLLHVKRIKILRASKGKRQVF